MALEEVTSGDKVNLRDKSLQSFQRKDLATWYIDIKEKEKREMQIIADFYASTTVNLATALGFSQECVVCWKCWSQNTIG